MANLARPGGNITGSSFLGAELVRKRMELLKEAVPRMSRVGILVHPGDPSEATLRSMMEDTEAAARVLGVQLHRFEARDPSEFDGVLATISREKNNGLMLVPRAMFFDQHRRIVDLALRLPAMFFFREFTKAGGFMSYGPNFLDLYRRPAGYVDKILRGAKPADLPVQQPTKLELIINLKSAKTLGLTIPQSVLARADHVIELSVLDQRASCPSCARLDASHPNRGADAGDRARGRFRSRSLSCAAPSRGPAGSACRRSARSADRRRL